MSTVRRRPPTARVLVSLVGALLLALGLLAPAAAHPSDPDDGKATDGVTSQFGITLPQGPQECVDGTAGPFPCDNIDLESIVTMPELGGGTGSDIWGWEDPETGREYAIMGTANGTAFVDVTAPTSPRVVAQMPTESSLLLPLWRDIKVHADHAYVVSEHDAHGLQVFDLTRLRDMGPTTRIVEPDTVYDEFSNAHNIAVNEDTGFLYAVGTNTCDGGLHMVDLADPAAPAFAGCFAEDGYTHDVECVLYDGRDGRFKGDEICFASNEDTLTIVDVTDKANPTLLSKSSYGTAAYTHQGSLTPDHRFFLFGDELDESNDEVSNTTTYIAELTKLDRPATIRPFTHETEAIDHNMYTHGDRVYQSNYTAGLRILEYDRASLQAGDLDEVAFFDVIPGTDVDEFAGTWSNYRFDSGTTVVSTFDIGLFVLRPQLAASAG